MFSYPESWMPESVYSAEKIGEGAEGDIWLIYTVERPTILKRYRKGRHQGLHRKLALMGLTESNENLRKILGVDITPAAEWLVRLEYCSGGSLRELIGQSGQWSLQKSCLLVEQVCNGLAALHECGYTHGDIKPENILLYRHSGAPIYKICDFGQVIHEDDPPRFVAMISREYVALERLEGKVSPKIDIFAVGIIWYEILTGIRIRSVVEIDYDLVGSDAGNAIASCLDVAELRPSALELRGIAADLRTRTSFERYVKVSTAGISFPFDESGESY